MERVEIDVKPHTSGISEYDWVDLVREGIRVGKSRCLIADTKLTIFSINIYPEFRGNGYGKKYVETAKRQFKIIVADRVRYDAIGFWEKAGFVRQDNGKDWIYQSE